MNIRFWKGVCRALSFETKNWKFFFKWYMMHRILHREINTIVKSKLIVLRFRSTPWSFLFCKISIPSNFHRFFFFRNVLNPLYKLCWRKLSKKDFCSFFLCLLFLVFLYKTFSKPVTKNVCYLVILISCPQKTWIGIRKAQKVVLRNTMCLKSL